MSARVSKALREQVSARADACCEYCGMPDAAILIPHEPDHVIAVQHGGATMLENLAYTCHQFNRFKGPNLASIDPESGARTFLFNPRAESWHDHFRWDGPRILAQTPICCAPSSSSFTARAPIERSSTTAPTLEGHPHAYPGHRRRRIHRLAHRRSLSGARP